MSSVSVPVANTDAPKILSKADRDSGFEVRWCSGCGDHAVFSAVHAAMPSMGLPKDRVVFVSGIGCSSRFPFYQNVDGIHTIHGRATTIAAGLKAHRPDLHVWIMTGEREGARDGQLVHAMHCNVDLEIMMLNATSDGAVRALQAGATFVARVTDTDAALMPQILLAARAHKGAAVVEVVPSASRVAGAPKLVLEHGKPMLFAGGAKGIGWVRGKLDVVDVKEGSLDNVLVHDMRDPDPAIALALAQFEEPAKPRVMGILRAVERPTYDGALKAPVDAMDGIESLVTGNATWRVA